MVGRTTRSKQKQVKDVAKASPSSTRSSSRLTASPTIPSLNLRSSSPMSLRSSSPSGSVKSVERSPHRGRGRRGAGVSSSSRGARKATSNAASTEEQKQEIKTASSEKPSSSEDEDDKPLAASITPKRGRGQARTRGRGRGGRNQSSSKPSQEEPDETNDSDSDSQPLAEIVHKNAVQPQETESRVKSPAKDIDQEPDSDSEETNQCAASEPDNPRTEVIEEAAAAAVAAQVEPSPDAAVIAELANRLAADDAEDWPESVDKVLLSEEHMKQLESVLTSDEGLKLLSEQQAATNISDMQLDVFPGSIAADSALVSNTIDDNDSTAVKEAEDSNDEKEDTKPSPTRRRSERVTDIERRTLAEKIRQENIKKEKELLEKLKAEKEKELPEASPEKNKADQSASSDAKKKPATGADGKGKKGAAGTPAAASKSSNKSKATASRAKSDSQGTPTKNEPQSEEKKTPEGGWVPGKVKVIDRTAEKNKEEKDKAKRKSLESKRRLSSAMDDLFKPDSPVNSNTRKERAKKTLRDDEVSGGEDSELSDEPAQEDDGSDDEWVDDDPDRLWCVCRKPHDNRFMICCDRCEEWYHGDCVGITRKRGQQMEIDNEEYICSECKEKELIEKLGGVEKLTELEEEENKKRTAADSPSSTGDKNTSNTTDKPSKVQGEIRKKDPGASKKEKRRFSSFHPKPPRQHCIGPSCDNWAEEGKIFCSLNCIMKHAKESLRIITKEKNKTMGGSAESAKAAPDIVVMERHTGRLVTGAHAPTEANLVAWLTKHPSFEVLRPGQQMGHVPSNKLFGKGHSKLLSADEKAQQLRRQSSSKDDSSNSSTRRQSTSGQDPSTIRSSVRKSLQEALLERIKELEEDEKSNKEDVKSIVSSIEHELHKYYGDTNSKYKARYRSLIFNIKDSKNKGLFRKILRKKLKPAKLVRMTPDELASKELHQWREKELKSELEKIKKDEELRAKMYQTPLRKITHKGEVVVEEETYEDLDTKLSEEVKDYDMDVIKTEPGRDISCLLDTPGVSVGHHVAPATSGIDVLSSIMGDSDTTSQHDAHLFDANCKICTGKQAAPTNAELERQNKRVRVSHVIHKSDVLKKKERHDSIKQESKEVIDKVVKTELQDLEKEIKEFEQEDIRIAENLEKHRELQSLSSQDSTNSLYSPKQEPSSTVQSPHSSIKTPPLPVSSPQIISSKKKITPSIWKGFIDVPEVCKFFATTHQVHGNADCLKADLPDSLQIVGRIHPSQVWDYLNQLKLTVTREVLIIRFTPANDEEKIGYKQYFKYLVEKKRFGVVGNAASVIKDMYILPLSSHDTLPSALKPYQHKVLTMDNRPHMLLGLIVRSKQKRQSTDDQSQTKKPRRVSNADDEPYEPPGFSDEPGTPPLPDSKPSKAKKSPVLPNEVEEYDPLQPDVSLAEGTVDEIEKMDADPSGSYDPIISAYSLADDSTLNAEDAPGAAPYSPGQEEEPMDDDEAYDPSEPLDVKSNDAHRAANTSYNNTNRDEPMKSPTTAAQEQLRAIEEQLQRKQLELQTAQMTLPKNISDIMSGKTIPSTQPETQPYNMMDYLKRTIASNQQKLENSASASAASTASSNPVDRQKISFSLGGKFDSSASQRAVLDEAPKPPQRLYVPAPSATEPPPLKPPPARPDMFRPPPHVDRHYDSAPPLPADPRGPRNPPEYDPYDNRGHNDRSGMRNWRDDHHNDPRSRHRNEPHYDRRDWDRFPPRGRGGPPRQFRDRRPYY